jgi:hypothetical protein
MLTNQTQASIRGTDVHVAPTTVHIDTPNSTVGGRLPEDLSSRSSNVPRHICPDSALSGYSITEDDPSRILNTRTQAPSLDEPPLQALPQVSQEHCNWLSASVSDQTTVLRFFTGSRQFYRYSTHNVLTVHTQTLSISLECECRSILCCCLSTCAGRDYLVMRPTGSVLPHGCSTQPLDARVNTRYRPFPVPPLLAGAASFD